MPFSCKSRGAYSSCAKKRAIAWAERMVREVLPDVPYVQLVFTIPKMLRQAFLFERKLYGELCRAAYAATRELFHAQFPTLEKAAPAMVAAPAVLRVPHQLSSALSHRLLSRRFHPRRRLSCGARRGGLLGSRGDLS